MRNTAPSPVTVTRYVNGVAQAPEIQSPSSAGYILCINDAGVAGAEMRVLRRSTSLTAMAAAWFDRGGEGGNAVVFRADGLALSATELNKARAIMAEME